VRANAGSRTPGTGKATVADIENRIGAGAFLAQVRDSLKSGEFRPVPVRHAMIPRRAASSASSAYPRRRHSAVSSSDPSGFVVVTHPFHPLNGQRLDVLYVKRRGADTVFVCSGGVSGQITLPLPWTDRGEPPLARRLSAERLAGLDTLIRSIRGR
jgi:hypothetical protein